MPQSNKEIKAPIFIFDLGGVVLKWKNNDPIFRYIAKRYRVPFPEVKQVLEKLLPIVESGAITCNDFIENSFHQLGITLRPGDNGAQLLLRPFARLVKLNSGTEEIVRSLRSRGYRVYGLTNTSPPHLALMKKRGWADLFDEFFASYELKANKPDPKIYRRVLKAIGANPSQVVFIDNTSANVRGARKSGIARTIRFRSISQLRKEIARVLRADRRYLNKQN